MGLRNGFLWTEQEWRDSEDRRTEGGSARGVGVAWVGGSGVWGVVVSLPDSLEAGRGEAMPWGRAEAAERGGGVFTVTYSGLDGAEQSREVTKDFTWRPASRALAALG